MAGDMMKPRKLLGIKNYGSIPHLSGSRLGLGDHHCHEGQERIATVQTRDKHDEIIVQEKLDGSNVGVARIGDEIYPLGRSGYSASTSPYEQHHYFSRWAYKNKERFLSVLQDGERLIGEWLLLAHGTKYKLPHEPFVALDLMTEHKRTPYRDFMDRIQIGRFTSPTPIWLGSAFGISDALQYLGNRGFHGSLEKPEGAVWRVERDRPTGKKGGKKRTVDFLVKYVRPDKEDGKYLPEMSENPPVWNEYQGERVT